MTIEIISDITLFFGIFPFALVSNQVASHYSFGESKDDEKALIWVGVSYGLVAMQFFSMAIYSLIDYL